MITKKKMVLTSYLRLFLNHSNMFPYLILKYVVRYKLLEDKNHNLDGDNEEQRTILHESKHTRNLKLFRKQIDHLTVQDSSSAPATPFQRTMTIVNINVSQSSSNRPPSSVCDDDGIMNETSSLLVTPRMRKMKSKEMKIVKVIEARIAMRRIELYRSAINQINFGLFERKQTLLPT